MKLKLRRKLQPTLKVSFRSGLKLKASRYWTEHLAIGHILNAPLDPLRLHAVATAAVRCRHDQLELGAVVEAAVRKLRIQAAHRVRDALHCLRRRRRRHVRGDNQWW